MFLGGEEGLLDEIRGTLFVTSTHLGDDNKERLQYADSMMRFYKACYGEKSQLTASPEPLEITVVQLSKDGSQGIKISKPEKDNQIIQANAAALLAAVKPISLEDPDDSINDPESLFNSPLLDTIRRKDETTDRTPQQTD